ncbi:MAG: type II toxin-antitoxin system VapC family toxin [Chloroflexota bacterium]
MILYMDTSALAKRYVEEESTSDVLGWMESADLVGTALITRAEMAAVLARAMRLKRLDGADALKILDFFRAEWMNFQRLPVNEASVSQADVLAFEYGLRGYDAVHLASALIWQDGLGTPVTLATFDGELRAVALQVGLSVLPE